MNLYMWFSTFANLKDHATTVVVTQGSEQISLSLLIICTTLHRYLSKQTSRLWCRAQAMPHQSKVINKS